MEHTRQCRGLANPRHMGKYFKATAAFYGYLPPEAKHSPPYLRRSADRLESGWTQDRTLWLCFGPASWDEAKWREPAQLAACLPPGDDPAGYDWTLATQFPMPTVLVWTGEPGTGDALADAVARALIRDGVRRVLGANTGDGLGDLWSAKEVAHAA